MAVVHVRREGSIGSIVGRERIQRRCVESRIWFTNGKLEDNKPNFHRKPTVVVLRFGVGNSEGDYKF
jgi:hypothetical protein